MNKWFLKSIIAIVGKVLSKDMLKLRYWRNQMFYFIISCLGNRSDKCKKTQVATWKTFLYTCFTRSLQAQNLWRQRCL